MTVNFRNYGMFSNCNRGNQAQLKQLCSFHSVAPHMGHPIQGN